MARFRFSSPRSRPREELKSPGPSCRLPRLSPTPGLTADLSLFSVHVFLTPLEPLRAQRRNVPFATAASLSGHLWHLTDFCLKMEPTQRDRPYLKSIL